MIDKDTDCFRYPRDTCTAGEVRVFLNNCTNAEDVLNGYAGPAFEQVGPFYFTATSYSENTFTVDAGRLGDPVSAIQTNYTNRVWQFHRHLSCPNCDLNAEIIGPNALYLGVMKAVGWQEANLIISMAPATLTSMITGMDMLFAGMGYNETNVLAINQWASCAELGGISFSSLHKIMPQMAEATQAFQSSPPEFCAYAQTQLTEMAEQQQQMLVPPLTEVLLDAQEANRILMDPFFGILNSANGATNVGVILQAPPFMISSIYNISELKASLLQGYVATVVLDSARMGFASLLGPRLGPGSSGILIRRTAEEWVYGYNDTLVNTLQPGTKPFRMALRPPAPGEHVHYDASEPMLFHSAVLATGREKAMREDVSSLISYNGQQTFSGMVDLRHFQTYLPETGRLRPRWVSFTGVIRNFMVFLSYPLLQRKTLKHFGYGEVKDVRTVQYRLLGTEPLYHCNASVPNCRQQHQQPHVYNVSHTGADAVVTYGNFAQADPSYKQSLGPLAAATLPMAVDALHAPVWDVSYAIGRIVKYSGAWQTNYMIRQSDLFHNTTWNHAPAYGGMWMPAETVHYHNQMTEEDAKEIKDAVQKLKNMQQITLLAFMLPAAILMSAAIWYFCLSAEAVHKRDERMIIKKRRQQSVLYNESMKVYDNNLSSNKRVADMDIVRVNVMERKDEAPSSSRVRAPTCCGC